MDVEIRNSKRTYLGQDAEGNHKFALDCSIAAIQYREPGGEWEDIDPSIEEPDSDDFTIKFTKLPYLGRIGDDSRRRIYPDRTNPDAWIEFQKPFASMPAPTRYNRWFYWDFPNALMGVRFDNTSTKFGFRLKNSSAPTSITVPFTTQGITRQGRFLYADGEIVGELKSPTAVDANGEYRDCDISFGTGEVTISLDTTGLTFPIDIDPALNLQVGQGTDDCTRIKNGDYWNTIQVEVNVGYCSASYQGCGMGLRFQNVTVPVGATINVAYISLKASQSKSLTTVNSRLRGQNNNNPITFSTQADFDARTWLGTTVDWDNMPSMTAGTWYDTPDISTIIQAIIALGGWASGNAMVFTVDDWDERSTQSDDRRRVFYHYDNSSADAPKLHIEYTIGGWAGKISGVTNPAKVAGVDAANIAKVKGVA